MTETASRKTSTTRADWARRGFAGACVLGFAALAGTVAAQWDGVLGTLLGGPRPVTRAAPVTFPRPSDGDRALRDARLRLGRGDRAGALTALEGVSPQDPAYPLARRLREQARAAETGSGQ